MNEKVVGVIVTYRPPIKPLSDLLRSLEPQVDSLVVVDNGSSRDFRAWITSLESAKIHTIFLGENRGIAAAQNIGIEWARARGADYVLLSDQDSIPAPDMVWRLTGALGELTAAGHKVAAVGPRFMDERRDIPPPFKQVRGFWITRGSCLEPSSIVPVDHLIASGCLIPLSVLQEVGLMQENLFIDYVDIEWGLRARERGYASFGVCAALMRHDLGDTPIRVAGMSFPMRGALRHYYIVRNGVWLYGHASIPFQWKLVDGWHLLLKFVFYSLFSRPRLTHFRMMSLGIWHGLTGRLGRLDK